MSQDTFKTILAKRRDRCIAVILGVKESECDEYLPPEAKAALRKVVLDTVNDYFDLCLDLMRSLETEEPGFVVNELYLQMIDDIHEAVVGGNSN